MKTIALPLLCLAIAAGPALAHDPAFVAASQTRADLILMAPPAPDSAVTHAELVELHRIEAGRSKEQEQQAIADEADESMFLYHSVLGDQFNAANLPQTAAFAKRVKNDEGVNSTPAKEVFHRMRPYNLDKTLHPVCKTKTKDDSYPSGHATAGYLNALALIDMVPERRDAILARAADYANNRLICGVHFASDIEASKLLAYATHAVMANNPQYRKEMAVARTELRAKLGLPAMAD
jgi:acid phosphatase (class A)